MHQNNETRSGLRSGVGARDPARRPGDVLPLHVGRDEKGESGPRISIVPASGGDAFLEVEPAGGATHWTLVPCLLTSKGP